MAKLNHFWRTILGSILVAMGTISPLSGQGPQLAMLDRLEPGRWEMRLRGGGGAAESLCLQNGRQLIQLRHPQNICERYIADDGVNEVTVQYACHGKGYGRTHIRRESSRLVQIDSQGIANSLPFDFVAEARRVGDCPN